MHAAIIWETLSNHLSGLHISKPPPATCKLACAALEINMRACLFLTVHFARAGRAIAWRARAFFFKCIEKLFFLGGPFFRAAEARLFLKR